MTKDKKQQEVLPTENPENFSFIKKEKTYGRVLLITKQKIVAEVNGNGYTMPFDSERHKDLKVGDKIQIGL